MILYPTGARNAPPMSINCTNSTHKDAAPAHVSLAYEWVCVVIVPNWLGRLTMNFTSRLFFSSSSSSLAAFRNSHRVIGPKMTLGNEKYTSFSSPQPPPRPMMSWLVFRGALLFALTHRIGEGRSRPHLRNEDVFQLLSRPPHLGLNSDLLFTSYEELVIVRAITN